MINTTINDCKLVDLNKNHNLRGSITAINNLLEIPFSIKRIYYLYDIPGGESRGGHAHKNLQQLIVAASGSFNILLDDGVNKLDITLNRPNQGLYMPPGLWREIINFSSGSICLVLASLNYSESDYIRDYNVFKNYKLNGGTN